MNLITKIKSLDNSQYLKFLHTISKCLQIEIPEKLSCFKSGVHRERLPDDPNWLKTRAASILIFCLHCPRSVKQIRLRYGGMRNRGAKPDRKYKASGYIHRHLMQIMEEKGLLIQHKKGRYTSKIVKQLFVNNLQL